jgi:aminopeptidase YwaD
VLTFDEKAANAETAGAVALLIANNEDGAYSGTLGDGVSAGIPVVAIRQAEGEMLRPLAEPNADQGVELTVRALIETIEVSSQNVVGRAGERCEVYLGAHYDSVSTGPGANDNASGTALLLEVARAQRTDGLCVVAFGAEEIGLFGSAAFVEEHDVSGARLMLNFDMVGRLDGPIIVGDDELTREILDALAGEFPIRAGEFPPFALSDHVSFSEAGVAAVTITSGDDPAIHTSDDEAGRISSEDLGVMLEIADVVVSALVAS